MKYLLAFSLFLATSIANANNVGIPAQTNLEIIVEESQQLYKWSLICNQNCEPEGNHPEGKAACNEIAQLQVPLEDAIENAEPNGPCILIYRPANLTVNGIVEGKQTTYIKEYANSCILDRTLTAAGLPDLVPFNDDGTYNTGSQ